MQCSGYQHAFRRFVAMLFLGAFTFGPFVARAVNVSSPVVVASHADLTQGALVNASPDVSISAYPGTGMRYWIATFYRPDSGMFQALFQGDNEHPFTSVAWTKPTCNVNSNGFCVNGSGVAFTQVMTTDTRYLWFAGLYQPQPNDGGMLALIHEEQAGSGNPYRIGLAWSTDSGNTWTYLGRIISTNGTPDLNIQGVAYLVKDGYLYVYYSDADDSGARGLSVARANVNDVVSAARIGGLGASLWHKYYAGDFTEAGLGGRTTVLLPNVITHTQAIHSQYTGKYYLPVTQMAADDPATSTVQNSFVKLYESVDGIGWTSGVTIADESGSSLWKNGGYQYCSVVDPDGRPNGETGAIFNVYCMKDLRANGESDNGLYRWRVDLSGGAGFYRQSKDFSSQQGPYWRYQTGRDSVIYDMTFQSSFWQGSDRWSAIYADALHPAANEIPVLKWIAPRAGTVRIEGTVRDADVTCGNGVSASVVHNGTQIFSADIDNGDTVGRGMDMLRQVAAGDGIFFMVSARGTDFYCDTTRWDPSIGYQ
jgi:hypothetical protein